MSDYMSDYMTSIPFFDNTPPPAKDNTKIGFTNIDYTTSEIMKKIDYIISEINIIKNDVKEIKTIQRSRCNAIHKPEHPCLYDPLLHANPYVFEK